MQRDRGIVGDIHNIFSRSGQQRRVLDTGQRA